MNDLEFARELAACDEKIALAELEEAKATQRTRELKYAKARLQLDFINAKVISVMGPPGNAPPSA